MEPKFFSFINPYLSFIDNGNFFRKPFKWVYVISAIIDLLLPLYILIEMISNRLFSIQFKYTITFLLVWVVIAFASWVSFQIWWDRRTKITFSSEDEEFVATPVLAHFIQTSGEAAGTWIGIAGCGIALFTSLFLGSQASMMSAQMGIPALGLILGSGWTFIFIMPILGFFIVVGARFSAELIKALAAIANNTKKQQTIP